MPLYKVINYQVGLISNITLEEFIEQILIEEIDYDLFQVIQYHQFDLTGGVLVTRLILKQNENCIHRNRE